MDRRTYKLLSIICVLEIIYLSVQLQKSLNALSAEKETLNVQDRHFWTFEKGTRIP